MQKPSPGLLDYGLLMLLALIWGSSFFAIKIAVETAPTISLSTVRLWISVLVVLAIAFSVKRGLPRDFATWRVAMVAALFGNALPFCLITWGEEHIDSGVAAITMGIMPLTTVLLAHFFTVDEKLNGLKMVAVGFGLAGLVVLIGPDKLTRFGDDAIRQLSVAGAAFCYAIQAVYLRRHTGEQNSSFVAAIMICAALMLTPAAFLVDQPLQTFDPSTNSWLAIIALGVFHTCIATFIMLAIIRRQGASFFSQINFLVPVFGVLWGVALLSERPSTNAYMALGLILVGIALLRRATR